MKKLSFISIIIGILITSCTTTAFLKRKYTKGYFIEAVSRKSSPEKKESASESLLSPEHNIALSAHQKNKSQNAPAHQSFINSDNTYPHLTSQINKSSNNTSIKYSKKEMTENKIQINHSNSNTQQHTFTQFKNNLTDNTHYQSSASAGENKIIQVILALFPFINLIAVYLHDGKQITANFWVCLILNILFFLPGIIFSLFALPLLGIIFSLLVVLDIVNIA